MRNEECFDLCFVYPSYIYCLYLVVIFLLGGEVFVLDVLVVLDRFAILDFMDL